MKIDLALLDKILKNLRIRSIYHMKRIPAQSNNAKNASELLQSLQTYFCSKLNTLSKNYGEDKAFEPIEWFRAKGKNGGGVRFIAKDESFFNRASVNYSQVQYDTDEAKNLASATALSTIIHPRNPHAPSMHMHFSWTEMKNNKGYWRMMADLNPSLANEQDKVHFSDVLKQVAPTYYEEASKQGDRYFNIPALNQHRGVSHFYLENYFSEDKERDSHMAFDIAKVVIDTYIDIVEQNTVAKKEITEKEITLQIEYHTLYLFQVLTLDRGTTSGLLVHNENDIGILGSIPSHVNTTLLRSWIEKMPSPQEKLLSNIIDVLGKNDIVLVDEAIKQNLANVVREHYLIHPEALSLQASGNVSVPTVENHK